MTIMTSKYFAVSLLFTVLLCACDDSFPTQDLIVASNTTKNNDNTIYPYQESEAIPANAYIAHEEVYNPESVIPPQCYTKTEGDNNPCYACHQTYQFDKNRSNQMNDGSLQGEYEFSDLGTKNHWKNLFVDRRPLIKGITDEKIQQWVTHNNYSSFIEKQENNGQWRGEFTPIKNLSFPDLAFDQQGLAKDNSHWVAFNYKPFPSTFWPTNGSTGDAMIRLPKAFREINGTYSPDVYFANLALVELTMKESQQMSLPSVSEVILGIDMNNDNVLSDTIGFIDRRTHYVGDASNVKLESTLYPEGTEFLHTVRYIGVSETGGIYNAPRMKEVRYMKKHRFKSRENLASTYYLEQKEKDSENLPQVQQLGDKGINTNVGWILNGYIEDEKGELRHQNTQELAFCSGCHKTIGSTLDQTFSFPRKVEGAEGWGYQNLAVQKDVPNIGETQGEFLTYFERVGGGDEFRQNKEMLKKWFTPEGHVNRAKVKSVASLYELITPSPERAMALNKAYFTIVKEQSFIFGRDANLSSSENVLKEINEAIAPLTAEHRYQWDIRLDWAKNSTDKVVKLSR